VLIYVGGILILILFAVMLTHRIADVRISNRSVGRAPALAIAIVIGILMTTAVLRGGWHRVEVRPATPTTAEIGNLFLTHYLLPFELASVVLLAALIGAAFLSRKELKDI
jgi:NADH-quinone oxidoreductase subunit J